MSFSEEVRTKALVACGRCCCLCHKFCGTKMEIHHIQQKSDEGSDDFDNAIPLCFDCHADVNSYNDHHPKGSKYTEKELRSRRDTWYSKFAKATPVRQSQEFMSVDLATFLSLNKYLDIFYMTWIRDTSLGGSFKKKDFFYFRTFRERSLLPAYEFIDTDLEKAKANLADSIQDLYLAAMSCVFCDERGVCSVPKEWIETKPDLHKKSIDSLNQLADRLWVSYCDFIRECRRKLDIPMEVFEPSDE